MIIIWLLFSIPCAIIAQIKGRSAIGWFFIGMIAGIFGLIAIAILPKNEETPDSRKCPFCAEYIKKEATIYKHCGKDLIIKNTNVDFKSITREEALRLWKANSNDKRSWGEVVGDWEKANKKITQC